MMADLVVAITLYVGSLLVSVVMIVAVNIWIVVATERRRRWAEELTRREMAVMDGEGKGP